MGLPTSFPRLTKMRPLGAFEGHAVVAPAGYGHLDAIGIFAVHGEVVRRVVAVVDRGVAVLKRYGMLGVGTVEFTGPMPSLSCLMAHVAMSTWWAPQSVNLPPEYSYHQRNS